MHRKGKYEQRASTLNGMSKRGGIFSVLASNAAAVDDSMEVSSFHCVTCKTDFGSNLPEPFCNNCGSMHVKASARTLRALPSEKQMSAVVCGACGAHNILDDRTALAMKGSMHCVSCGSETSYPVEQLADAAEDFKKLQGKGAGNDVGPHADDDPITKADETQLDDIVKKKEAQKATSDDGNDVGPHAEDKPITHADETQLDDIVKKKEAQKADFGMDEDESEGESDIVEPITDEDLEMSDDVAETDDVDDAAVGGDAEIDVGEMEKDDEPSAVACSLLSTVKKGKVEFSIGYHGTDVLAFINELPVARLSKETAGDFEDVMMTPAFEDAVTRVAKADGIKKALAHFGFKAIQVRIPMDKIQQQRIAKSVEAKTQQLDKQVAELADDIRQCLSIAAVGINRGFFRSHGNPIKAAFFEALSAAGVQRPEKLIDRVFAAHGDAYHKTLFEVAEDLRSKPLDVRNALSETIGMTEYQKADSEADMDFGNESDEVGVEGEGSELSSHLEVVAKPAAPRIQLASQNGAATVREMVKTATAGRGRLFLGSN